MHPSCRDCGWNPRKNAQSRASLAIADFEQLSPILQGRFATCQPHHPRSFAAQSTDKKLPQRCRGSRVAQQVLGELKVAGLVNVETKPGVLRNTNLDTRTEQIAYSLLNPQQIQCVTTNRSE